MYVLLRQGGVSGLILVGRLDLLDVHWRDTQVNARDRFLLIEMNWSSEGGAWRNFKRKTETDQSISV